MQYRDFGKTGIRISALGFGAMRLPMIENNVDEDKAIEVIKAANRLGINYFDSAYMYCNGQSETVLGKAVKGFPDKVFISTKFPYSEQSNKDDYRRILEEQLQRLDMEYIDFYHFHGLNYDDYENLILKNGLMEEAFKVKQEKLIRHISFSFHDKPENMVRLVDTGNFESVLCQYNMLDRSNEPSIAYAREKGLGVVIMGPVGGGRLGAPSQVIQSLIPGGTKSSAELALRFVLSNRNVSCALSGMSSIQMVQENAETASNLQDLTRDELSAINAAMEQNKKLAELYCTGCNYCMPCPNDINIPLNFQIMNYHRVYGLTDYARSQYRHIGSGWMSGKRADECTECGLCEPKCPQKIAIRSQLKETAKVLG
jgi:uncharacterized protein